MVCASFYPAIDDKNYAGVEKKKKEKKRGKKKDHVTLTACLLPHALTHYRPTLNCALCEK